MKQNISKKYSLVLIIFLVIVTLGLTYSFFGNVGNTLFSNDAIVTSNTTDLLIFQIDNDIDFEVSQQDFVSGGNNKSGYTNARAILVPNNKTGNATMNYYMYLNIENNPIDYSSTNTNELPELMLQLYDGNNELVTIDYLDEMVTVKGVTGYDITGYEGLIPLLDNQEIVASNNAQTTQEWKVVVTLINLDINQNDNTGKELIAEVIMQKDPYEPGANLSGNLAVVIDDETNNDNLMKEYRGEGYYHDEFDNDSEHPFFTRPIYYFEGDTIDNTNIIKNKWNVVFGNICWQVFRTTENGGVKLVYNGEPIISQSQDNGKLTYDCSENRPKHMAFGGRETQSGFSSSEAFYYGTDYEYDEANNNFRLTGTIISKTWNENNISDLESKYTCKSSNLNATCNTIYLIESYKDSTTAYVYPINSTIKTFIEYASNDLNFNNKVNSLSSVGYMYNEEYETASISLASANETLLSSGTQTTVNLSSVTLGEGLGDYWYGQRYFSSTYSYSNGVYTLTGTPERAATIKANSANNDYSDLVGMYTIHNSDSATATRNVISYIFKVEGEIIYYVNVSNNINPNAHIVVGDSLIDNNDNTYTLSNPASISAIDFYTNQQNYRQKYICSDGVSSTCNASDIKIIYDTSNCTTSGASGHCTYGYSYGNNINYKLASSITDNNNDTYSLNSPVSVDSLSLYNNYANYQNYYICSDGTSTTCSYANMRYMHTTTQTSYSYYSSSINEYKVASNVTKSGNNYILNNPVTIKAIDNSEINWVTNNSNYNNYYICDDNISNTCGVNNIRYISNTSNTTYTYYPIYIYSNKFNYSNGVYTLDMSDSNAINIPGPINNYNAIGKAHYTCFNSSGVCETINYVYNVTSNTAYYVPLTGGRYISTDESNVSVFKNNNNVLYTMLYSDNVNNKNSTIKILLDGWYTANLMNYTPYIDSEEIYCNDRRTSNNYGSWNNNSDNITTNFNFINQSDNGNINCRVKTDAFSATETTLGNGNLTYPVGLLSLPEVVLMNRLSLLPNKSWLSGWLDDGNYSNYWLSSPTFFDFNSAYGKSTGAIGASVKVVNPGSYGSWPNFNHFYGNLRPTIALPETSLEFSQGDGSVNNPYVINVGNTITLNDINYYVSKTKAVQGEEILVSHSKYIVGSFKLNGNAVTGNTFIMPDENVEITDVKVYKVKDNSNNNNVILPNSAIPGNIVNITLKNIQGYTITSFKLNGTTTYSDSFVMPYENVIITDIVIEDTLISLRNNSNYRILDYIEFTGTQYIDTGIIPSNHMTEVKFDHSSSNDIMLFSTASNGGYYEFQPARGTYYYGTNGTQRNNGVLRLNTIRTVIYNGENGLIKVNDDIISTGYTINSSNRLMIGSRGTNTSWRFEGKVYYFKVIDKTNSEMVRWMIPVVRVNDDEIGMYDVINNVFYTNGGTGSFTRSPLIYDINNTNNNVSVVSSANAKSGVSIRPINDNYVIRSFKLNGVLQQGNGFVMPYEDVTITDVVLENYENTLTNNGYSILDYIEFSGGQYINTGIIPSNHELDITFDWDSYEDEEYLFGVTQDYYHYHFSSVRRYYIWGRNGNEGNGGEFTTGIHTLVFNGDNNIVKLDDTTLGSGVDISATTNLYIGRRVNSSSLKGKVYNAIIKDKSNGTIVRYFVPVVRIADGVAGMYDVVNDIFYTNDGTGSFKTPNNAVTNSTLNSLITAFDSNSYFTKKDYLQFNGGQYLNIGIIPSNHTAEAEFDFTSFDKTEYIFLTSRGVGYYEFSSNNYQGKYVWGTNGTWATMGPRTTGRSKVIYNDSNGSVIVDDVTLGTGYTIMSDTDLYIGYSAEPSEYLTGIVYYFKLTDKSTNKVVRYMIPCVRNSDGVAGMYDVVNDIFYTNQGSGTFTVPS